MTTNPSHEVLFHQRRVLIRAHCEHCHDCAGVYWDTDNEPCLCDQHPKPEGGWIAGACICDPPPHLPTGDELAEDVDRARLAAPHTPWNHAPKTIRVR